MDLPPFDRGRSDDASSRLRILRTRQRVREGSGPTVSPIGLRRRIRDMIVGGQLPALIDRRSWIGQGHGQPCLLCEQMITPAHWEHEVEIAPLGEIRAHGVCFRIWVEESEDLRKIA